MWSAASIAERRSRIFSAITACRDKGPASRRSRQFPLSGQCVVDRAAEPVDDFAGAWTPDQVIDVLIDGMGRGDFYLLCPDNEVTREIDIRRIQ